MKNVPLFTALIISCLFYVGCSQEEQLEAYQPEQIPPAPKMISSKSPDATMLAAVGLSASGANARMAQLYDEAKAVVAVYETAPEVEFLFIPYENKIDKVGIFPFYKGKYIPFQADLERVGDDDIRVTTESGIATYTREGNILKEVDFVQMADVMTADEIKEMRMQRRTDSGVDEMIGYYQQCMEDVVKAGSWWCGGCPTGQLMFSIGCFAFEPCLWGANVTCIALAIAEHERRY